MLEKVKELLAITTNQFDIELNVWIESAQLYLKNAGVPEVAKENKLYLSVVALYVKAFFDSTENDNASLPKGMDIFINQLRGVSYDSE